MSKIGNSFNIKKFLTFLLLLLNIIFFINKNIYSLEKFNYFFNKNAQKMNLVVPLISKDFEKIYNNLRFYINYIDGIKNVVFIGNEEIENLIKEKGNKYSLNFSINFINEKILLDIDKIKQLINKRNKYAIERSGWYIQQFLKMIYCNVCQDEFYLIWDSDTIPVKKVNMFNSNGKPFFDVKTEYHKPYFITMKKIFPDLGKKYKFSFVSEHMIIKTNLMKNMINLISANNNLIGDTWYEKIINCINIKDLPRSGFSEYETYGTFVKEYYKQIYDIRPWKSLREGYLYFNPKFLSDDDINKISNKYNSVSFENSDLKKKKKFYKY